MRTKWIALTLLLTFFVTLIATEATADIRKIGQCRSRGDFASCVAGGSVNDPARLWVKVIARPSQRVDGSWSVVCSRGTGAGSRIGDYAGVTPLKKRVRMNFADPDHCSLSSAAQLSDGGFIRVLLLARV
jgi:hypothetical protein